MTTNKHFHNYFLDEHGAHLSISTAVAMGHITRAEEDGMLIVRGELISEQEAIEAGIIDEMAADYLASLPMRAMKDSDAVYPYRLPVPTAGGELAHSPLA